MVQVIEFVSISLPNFIVEKYKWGGGARFYTEPATRTHPWLTRAGPTYVLSRSTEGGWHCLDVHLGRESVFLIHG